MVKFYQQRFFYEYVAVSWRCRSIVVVLEQRGCVCRHPWELVTYAFWMRYPNPFSKHVLAADVIDRSFDPETGVLKTTRLLLKQGVLPRWGQAVMTQCHVCACGS